MQELKMPVRIFRGEELIGEGEFLPNGNAMALCMESSNDGGFQLLDYSIDTRLLEEKIPLKIWREGIEIAEGELFQSGSNICVCPNQEADLSLSLIDPDSIAELHVQKYGREARLDIKGKCH